MVGDGREVFGGGGVGARTMENIEWGGAVCSLPQHCQGEPKGAFAGIRRGFLPQTGDDGADRESLRSTPSLLSGVFWSVRECVSLAA